MEVSFLTVTELSRRLGVRPYRIQYAIQCGDLPAPVGRIGNHRVWNSAEAEQVRQFFAGPRRQLGLRGRPVALPPVPAE